MTAAAQQPGPNRTTQHEDAAWVEITTALSVAELRSFLNDIERLYRINPLLEISTFEATGGSTYRFAAHNRSNGRQIDLVLAVTQSETAVEIRYSDGVKVSTSFRAEPAEGGARLFVTDVYGRVSQEERRERAGEVDLSLNAWGRALHDYLRAWARWKWLAPWCWYMRRVWQPMKPSARRIVWMIWVVSAFEVVALVGLLAVWLSLRWMA